MTSISRNLLQYADTLHRTVYSHWSVDLIAPKPSFESYVSVSPFGSTFIPKQSIETPLATLQVAYRWSNAANSATNINFVEHSSMIKTHRFVNSFEVVHKVVTSQRRTRPPSLLVRSDTLLSSMSTTIARAINVRWTVIWLVEMRHVNVLLPERTGTVRCVRISSTMVKHATSQTGVGMTWIWRACIRLMSIHRLQVSDFECIELEKVFSRL